MAPPPRRPIDFRPFADALANLSDTHRCRFDALILEATAPQLHLDLDAGRYGASWEEAAPLLKDSMPRAQWETGLVRARGPLGVLVARKIRLASCTRGTQADPEAEICVIQYDSRFENRLLADERITVQGQVRLDMRDYNIRVPRLLLLPMKSEVLVGFAVVARPVR